MNQKALQLYDQMQTDLSLCKKKEMGRLKEIECCFHIAERYWAILRHELINHVFDEPADEITFFKVIKPRFTSEAEYYGLCYHAALFKAETDAADHPAFWRREARRLEKFEKDHPEFVECYKNGCRENDGKWFMRNDPEDKGMSSHDPLVATYLALKRYNEYVQEELNKYRQC